MTTSAQLGFFEEVDGEVRLASKQPQAKRGRKRGTRSKRSKLRQRGAKRPGPKPRENRKGFVKHATRPEHHRRHPVHVTMRRVRLAPSFREETVYRVILAEVAASKRAGVRVAEYSVQHDHLHLMVEGENSADLAKQMCRLFSRIAMAVNRLARRFGPLFRDRHHRHALKNPTEVRNALVYILFNARKHFAKELGEVARTLLDGYSSAPWFEEWDPNARPPPETVTRTRAHSSRGITSRPRTWLARIGWQRGGPRGPLRFDEQPLTAS